MPSSTLFNQGDILLVPFPFTDQSGDKQRPAMVISAGWYNSAHKDLILAAITSQIPSFLARDELPLTPNDISQASLIIPCILLAGKLFSIEKSKIVKCLGKVSTQTRIDALSKVRAILSDNS